MMRIDDTYALLVGMEWFATLDFSDGFYQIEIFPTHRERTAFKVPGEGQWQYKRMAQGLAGAPATFNYVVNVVLGPIRELWLGDVLISMLSPFVDDVLIASRKEEWQVFHFAMVLEAMRAANMVLSPTKTKVLQKSVKYLGRRIDSKGILPTKEDIKRVAFWPKPETKKQARSYLGFINFLSEFVEFEKGIVLPIRELKVDHRQHLKWTTEANEAFASIRNAIMNAMRLAFPIYGKSGCPFIVTTDASKAALGATLSQKQPDGRTRVVSFGSRTMSLTERRYSMPHKEILASTYGLLKFDRIIRGQEVIMELDHLALVKSFLSGKASDEKVKRWLVILQTYMPLQVDHIRSERNISDLLSRNPYLNTEWELLDIEEREMFSKYYVNGITVEFPARVSAVEVVKPLWKLTTETDESDVSGNDTIGNGSILTAEPKDEFGKDLMLEAQLADEWCSKMMTYLNDPTSKVDDDIKKKALEFIVHGGRLFKTARLKPRLYVPPSMREAVIRSCHDSTFAGHGGNYATTQRIELDYYWRGIGQDVKRHVGRCDKCQKGKHGPYQHVHSGRVGEEVISPFHTVNLDIKGPITPTSRGGNKFIVSWICTATRYAEAYAVPKKDAKNVVDAFTRLNG
jgi:hypothetical protein